jgi:hypothetical protein
MSQENLQDEPGGMENNLPETQTPYTVPDGYFDGLAQSILSKIKDNSIISTADELNAMSPLLASISRKMPYSVPENYFTSLTENLPILINEDQESAILKYIDRGNPFEVPVGYFENLPDQVLNKVSNRNKGARVIPMRPHKWRKLAVAASIAVIAVSGVFYFTGKSISKDPIAQIKTASNNELNDFLNTTDINPSSSATASFTNTGEVKQLLQDVPDNELNNFVNQEGLDDGSLIN